MIPKSAIHRIRAGSPTDRTLIVAATSPAGNRVLDWLSKPGLPSIRLLQREDLLKRLTLIILVLGLVAAACGGPAEVDVADSPATTASSTTTTEATTTTTTTEATTTTTEATTTTTAAAEEGIVAGQDPEVDAIVLAYTIALDSVSPFEDKAPYIDDPSGLEETVAKYLETGESMGGIGVRPTAVTIDGDTAVVTYDLLFGGNPTYPDLTGPAVKTAEGWKITRAGFCSLMGSARVGCP